MAESLGFGAEGRGDFVKSERGGESRPAGVKASGANLNHAIQIGRDFDAGVRIVQLTKYQCYQSNQMPMPITIIPTSKFPVPTSPRPFVASWFLDIPYNKMPHPTNNMMIPIAVVI